MFFFYFSLVCYLLFAVLLTTFALELPNPLSPTCTYAYILVASLVPTPSQLFSVEILGRLLETRLYMPL